MSIEMIRKANTQDQPELHRLWETVFGDPPEMVQAFFDRFPQEIAGWVLTLDDQICSAAYLLPGNWYVNRSEIQPAAYVYAVATDPSARRKGYAGRLMREIASFAEERGLLLYTRPAEQSLFPWYGEKLDACNVGYFKKLQVRIDSAHDALPCLPLSPGEYGAVREQYLAETPHLILSENFLRLQETYSSGFYQIGGGCCCVTKENDTLHIPELLAPNENIESCVQALLTFFGAQKAIVRSPGSDSDEPGIAYAGMIRPSDTNWGFFLE